MNKKRIGALLLGSMMMCTTVTSYAANFKDLNNHWSQKYVDDVVSKGIVKGYDDNTFRPSQPVTKIESIIMICNLFQESEINDVYAKNKAKYKATMTKSKIPTWAEKYIVFGVEKKLFPEKSIPYFMNETKGKSVQSLSFRQEFSMLLVNALSLHQEFAKTPSVKYTDAKNIDAKALPYIEVLGRKGIIAPTGEFNPKKKLTRAEAAVMLSKSYPMSPKGKGKQPVPATPTKPTPTPASNVNKPTVSETSHTGKVGTVYVNGNNVTINWVDAQGTSKVFTNTVDQIKVTIDGATATVTDVKRDAKATLKASGNKVLELDVTTGGTPNIPNPQNAPNVGAVQFVGTVKSYVDDKLEVESTGETRTFDITNNSKILINGKEERANKLQAGQSVTVVSIGNDVIQAIATTSIKTTETFGVIKNIDRDSITITTPRDGIVKYDVTSSTKIYRGSNRLDSLERLYVGEKISVKAEGYTATSIEVEESKISLRGAVVVGVSLRTRGESEIIVEDRDKHVYTLQANNRTKIYVENRLRSLDNVKLGYEVDVKAENGYIVELSTEREYATQSVQGKVISVDFREDILVVDTGSREAKVIIGPKTEIRNSYNNSPRSLNNIFEGYEIRANGSYHSNGFEASRIIYFDN